MPKVGWADWGLGSCPGSASKYMGHLNVLFKSYYPNYTLRGYYKSMSFLLGSRVLAEKRRRVRKKGSGKKGLCSVYALALPAVIRLKENFDLF